MTGVAALPTFVEVRGTVSYEPFPAINGEYLSDLVG